MAGQAKGWEKPLERDKEAREKRRLKKNGIDRDSGKAKPKGIGGHVSNVVE